MSHNSYYTEQWLRKDMEMMGREMDGLRDDLLCADRDMAFLEGELEKANAALHAAWDLLRPEAREKLLENDYAEELFWDEPERIERDSR